MLLTPSHKLASNVVANFKKMNKLSIVVIYLCLSIRLEGQELKLSEPKVYPKIAICNDDLFQLSKIGYIGKDSIIEQQYKDNLKQVKSIGGFAINKIGEISNLKTGIWIENYPNGQLKEKGKYEISSFIDCGTAGLIRSYYFYKVGEWLYYYDNGQLKATGVYERISTQIDTRCEPRVNINFSKVNTTWKFYDRNGIGLDYKLVDKSELNCSQIEEDDIFIISYCFNEMENKIARVLVRK